MKKLKILTALIAALSLSACKVEDNKQNNHLETCKGVTNDVKSGQKNTIYTSMYAIEYSLDRLVEGSGIEVENVLAEDDKNNNPHTYEITIQQLADIVDSDAFFGIGDGFEPYLHDMIENNEVDVVQTMCYKDVLDPNLEGHYHEGEDTPHVDNHFFTSPKRMLKAIDGLYNTLSSMYDYDFSSNYNTFKSELEIIDTNYKAQLNISNLQTNYFTVTHNAYGYLEEYGLHQIYILDSAEVSEISAKQQMKIINEMKSQGITHVLYEENIPCIPGPTIIREVNDLDSASDAVVAPYKVYFRNFTTKNSNDSDSTTLLTMYEENLSALIKVMT